MLASGSVSLVSLGEMMITNDNNGFHFRKYLESRIEYLVSFRLLYYQLPESFDHLNWLRNHKNPVNSEGVRD